MKLRRLAALVSAVVLALGMVTAVTAHDKITICHAAGLDGTTKYVTLTIDDNAVYGPGGHFNENGTPQAGHEQDYFGACKGDEASQEPQWSKEPSEEPSSEPSQDASTEPSTEPSQEGSVEPSTEASVPECSNEQGQPTVCPPTDGQVEGLTSNPTLPPTDAISSNSTSSPDSTLPLVLIVLGVIGLAAVVLTPIRAKR